MKHSVIETANYPRSLTQDVSNGLHAQAGKKELLDPILVGGVQKRVLNRANSAHKKGLDQCEAWETDRTISTLRLEPLGKAEHEQQQIVVGFGIGRLGNTGHRTMSGTDRCSQHLRTWLLPDHQGQGSHSQRADQKQTSSDF